MEAILAGMQLILDGSVCIALFCGTLLGIIFGAIPGLTSTMGIALLVPITFSMQPAVGIACMIGMYSGAIYGGSISAILLNIPGTPSSMMTSLDGYPLSARGSAGLAIGVATISSFVGGEIGVVCLIFAAPALAKFALDFGPSEYVALCVFGLAIIANLSSGNLLKGILSGLLGVFFSTVGMDPITSIPRFTFGNLNLLACLPFLPVLLGLFGFREFMEQLGLAKMKVTANQNVHERLPSWGVLRGLTPTFLRGGLLGAFIGALPGAGGPIASFLAYDVEKRVSKCPEKFGTGHLPGVAASESANNAVNGGAFIPMLTLGIPGDGNTAIMLGALMMHNLRPGPMLFVEHADFVSAIYLLNFLGNICMLLLGLLCIRSFIKISLFPLNVLLPIVSVFCIIGSYSITNSVYAVQVMLFFGVLGYVLSLLGIPFMPMVLGFVLGPIAEGNFRSALQISSGDWSILFNSGISIFIFGVTAFMLAAPRIYRVIKTMRS